MTTERTPAGHEIEAALGDRSERGFLSIAAPGAVAGCCDAHAMLSRLPLAQVMAPAIEAAQQGIEIAWLDLLPLVEVSHRLDAFPDTRAAWMPGGAFPRIAFQRAEGDRIDGAARQGEGRFAGAGSGGYRTQTAVLHAFMNVVDHRMRIQRAIDHPRVHCQGRETWVDARIPPAVRRRLARAGHEIVVVEENPGSLHFARVAAVTREPRSGVLRAGAGPVWRTAAAGY